MKAAATKRLFFALWPDERARARLARIAAEVAHVGQGRTPRPESLHLTLAFLGEVSEDRVALAEAAGARAADAVDPFALALDQVGGNAYGVAWFTPAAVPSPLHELQDALAEALAASGFDRERRMFRPHVTLARDCVRSAQRGPMPPVEWSVERLSLVASTLGPGGSRYADLASWPLRRSR